MITTSFLELVWFSAPREKFLLAHSIPTVCERLRAIVKVSNKPSWRGLRGVIWSNLHRLFRFFTAERSQHLNYLKFFWRRWLFSTWFGRFSSIFPSIFSIWLQTRAQRAREWGGCEQDKCLQSTRLSIIFPSFEQQQCARWRVENKKIEAKRKNEEQKWRKQARISRKIQTKHNREKWNMFNLKMKLFRNKFESKRESKREFHFILMAQVVGYCCARHL